MNGSYCELASIPVPVLAVERGSHGSNAEAILESKLFNQLSISGPPLFRGVSLDRLPIILRSGIDVEPSDNVFYATDDPRKALEYGIPLPGELDIRVVMMLDATKCERAVVSVPSSIDPAELEKMKRDYPVQAAIGETKLRLSRLPADRPDAGSNYEAIYGYWIRKEQMRALISIFLIGADIASIRTSVAHLFSFR